MQTLGLFVRDVDALDLGASRPLVAEGDQSLDCLRFAFEDRLHRPVGRVSHETGQLVSLGEAPGRIPEENALHVSVDYDAAADHAGASR